MSYKHTFSLKRLWIIFGVVMFASFATLLFYGKQIYQQAPPIPGQVVTANGQMLFAKEDIQRGQQVWRSIGGMQLGSVWGHGSLVAPDWSADWLHREALALADIIARRQFGRPYADLDERSRSYIVADLRHEMRANTYKASGDTLVISEERARAIEAVAEHYRHLFSEPEAAVDPAVYHTLREQMAFPRKLRIAELDMTRLGAFFFWTSWSAVTERPGQEISYTSNWPHEKLVGNVPSAELFIWSFVSVIILLAGIAALCAYYVQQYDAWRDDLMPEGGVSGADAMSGVGITPSMKATYKYFATVVALILVQVTLGAATAHYAVEGHDFYGIPLSDIFPYTVTRTWHIQSALFWIATSWLATGLFFAPMISGREPKFQRLGVNFLYVCLLIIVVGSFAGEWMGAHQMLGSGTQSFWFGHQGYEYIDLGRFWQVFLFIGLLVWLGLMLRGLWPALKAKGEGFQLLVLLVIASVSIALLYGAGFFWGQRTHLAVAEYWRWWVVHLWVEGVFEVFATTIIAILFTKMGLLRQSTATVSVIFAALIFLSGGVLGTFHHLYFSGTPIGVIALGSVFSALEVVPLVVIGFEAYNHYKVERLASSWIGRYHWPLMFLFAVSFWNLVGAGLLGFLINPPLALYYMQGLNTTPLHAHAALFGVYGMLGIGLTLFCLNIASRGKEAFWQDNAWLKRTFWLLNIGLAMMLATLLPQGMLQTIESYNVGYWAARAPEFIHSDAMEWLVWLRTPGDIVFTLGVACLAVFVYQLFRYQGTPEPKPLPAGDQATDPSAS